MRAEPVLGSLVLALVVALGPAPARAQLQDQMGTLFDSLVNAGSPAAFNTARRGAITGGNVYVRSPIVDENLVSFVPPSFTAGCGGIDLFAGSFSFINADQLVTTMKAVASNAVGYSFQMALSTFCESCMGTIKTLFDKINEMNRFFGNSCQLAQGIMNDTLGAAGLKRVTDASVINTASGIGDVFESFWTGTTGQNSEEAAEAAQPAAYASFVQGNIVWRALKRHDVGDWFVSGTGDDEMLEVAMNVAGSIVVGPLEEDEQGVGRAPTITRIVPKPELLGVLIDGGEARIQGCANGYDADECTELTFKTITVDGFRPALEEILRGTPGDPGVVEKVVANTALDEDEERIIAMLPSGTGGLVIRLAHFGPAAADSFARQAAPLMAMDLAEQVMKDMMRAVTASMTSADEAYATEVRLMHAESWTRLQAELQRLQARHGSIPELLGQYANLMNATNRLPLADTPTIPMRR